MHISLTEKLEDYVKSKVQSGLYNNASEVVREALRLKIAADETDEVRLQRLRDAEDPAAAPCPQAPARQDATLPPPA